jgi:hypothetical protein
MTTMLPPVRNTKSWFIPAGELFMLDRQECNLPCSGCGAQLTTEGDFARHFVIRETAFLNLGECPKTPKGRAIIDRGTVLNRR